MVDEFVKELSDRIQKQFIVDNDDISIEFIHSGCDILDVEKYQMKKYHQGLRTTLRNFNDNSIFDKCIESIIVNFKERIHSLYPKGYKRYLFQILKKPCDPDLIEYGFHLYALKLTE